MKKLNKFIKASFIGGVLILLPVAILIGAFNWMFRTITNLIQPITNLVVKSNGMPELLGDIVVVILIALTCFLIGTAVTTSAGKWLHRHFDRHLLRLAPGYKLVKEIVGQFFGEESSSPFANGEVARVSIFGTSSGTTVTALVTSKHQDGSFTVFVPTGPNPTSGNMYHLPPEQVQLYLDVGVEDMMKTIIACGAGSDTLFKTDKYVG